MGKSSAPETPDYVGQAIATANAGKFSEASPTGNISWATRPGADPSNPQPGDYIRTTTLSPEQQALYNQGTSTQLAAGKVANAQLGQLGDDASSRQALQDALYKRSTQYYDQNFGDQEAALRSRLVNSGLAEGSEAYNRGMRNFGQTRDTAYSDAANTAVINAEGQSQTNQNNAVNRLAQILAMSRGQSPTSANANAAGPDLSQATQSQYTAQSGNVNAANAASAQTTTGFSTAAGMALAAYLY
jgi:hypothetical protein